MAHYGEVALGFALKEVLVAGVFEGVVNGEGLGAVVVEVKGFGAEDSLLG